MWTLKPLLDALHPAQEGADGAVFRFRSQELCVSVGKLDISQLPPAVQTCSQQLPETQESHYYGSARTHQQQVCDSLQRFQPMIAVREKLQGKQTITVTSAACLLFSSFRCKLTWVWPQAKHLQILALTETMESPRVWSKPGNSPSHLRPWGHMTEKHTTLKQMLQAISGEQTVLQKHPEGGLEAIYKGRAK